MPLSSSCFLVAVTMAPKHTHAEINSKHNRQLGSHAHSWFAGCEEWVGGDAVTQSLQATWAPVQGVEGIHGCDTFYYSWHIFFTGNSHPLRKNSSKNLPNNKNCEKDIADVIKGLLIILCCKYAFYLVRSNFVHFPSKLVLHSTLKGLLSKDFLLLADQKKKIRPWNAQQIVTVVTNKCQDLISSVEDHHSCAILPIQGKTLYCGITRRLQAHLEKVPTASDPWCLKAGHFIGHFIGHCKAMYAQAFKG